MDAWSWWLIAAVALALGELVVFTGFILGPLALAAAVTAIVAAFDVGMEIQLAVFAVLATVSITLLRPIAKRHMNAPPEILTNVAALVGKRARVISTITDDAQGLIRLENENWSASPAPGIDRIEPETHVRVVEINGATAVVEPLESTSANRSQGDPQ
ncbi:MAG: NfeD family protein [Solirubrobacterales bacterium]